MSVFLAKGKLEECTNIMHGVRWVKTDKEEGLLVSNFMAEKYFSKLYSGSHLLIKKKEIEDVRAIIRKDLPEVNLFLQKLEEK